MIIILTKKLNENVKRIKEKYHNSFDITFRDITFSNEIITLIYSQTLCNSSSINDYILKNISDLIKTNTEINYKNILNILYNTCPSHNIKEIFTYSEVYKYLGNGFTIILLNNIDKAIAIETKEKLSRSIEKPITEKTISGPKDSFNENYITNIGLVRKRIKSTNLVIEEKEIGKETKTKVSLLYMTNIIEKELLESIKQKLDNIDIDGILDSTYIRNCIESKNTVFSSIQPTERPDVVCMSLLDGKVCISVENSPYFLIIPTFFIDLFETPEDNYQKSKNVSFTRIIRIVSFLIAVLLPAFYIAITTFNQETIPNTLLINFAVQREGVPFPAIVEAIGMSLIFEILRESDVRMPSLSGSAISILGAIVLGDAAVSAGVVSPIMVIVIAISAICSLMFSHISMTNGIRWWRLLFMIFSTILGLPGIFFCGILFIIYLSDLKSFGKPYLFPFAPFNFNFLKKKTVKENIKQDIKRNPLLTDINYTRSDT